MKMKKRKLNFMQVSLILSIVSLVRSQRTLIQTAIIYDEFYVNSLPSFRTVIEHSSLTISHTEFFQGTMTNIVETITAEKVSSLFILTKHINCTAMIELKQAVTIFYIGKMRDHCEPGDDFMMYMYPSHSDIMRAMYNGIEAYEWKTAAVFYDGSEEFAFDYSDLDVARQRGINFKVWVIPENQDEMWGILKSVRLLGYRTYILLCDQSIAASVLTKAVFLSMVSEVNHWVLPNLETHPLLLEDFLESSVRLTILSAVTIRHVLEENFVRDIPLHVASDEVISAVTSDAFERINLSCQKAISIGCFDIALSDDRQCGVDQGAKSFSEGSYYSIGTCTELYMRGLKNQGPTRIEYLEHHLENPKGHMSLQGYWKDDPVEFLPGYIPFVQAAVVFPEEPLQVGIVYEPPWLRWHTNEVTAETTYEGFLIDLLETLSRRLNFKYELHWNELIGPRKQHISTVDDEVDRMLRDKKVEFVLYTRPVLGGNLGKREQSIAFQQVSYHMITLSSGNAQPVDIWQFLAPFTFDSWIVLISALIGVSIMLAIVNRFNPFEWRKMALDETNDDVDVEEFNKLGFGNSVWMAYGGLVHQGVDIEPRSYAGRMITGTWWYFAMLVIAAYTANLTAFLTQEFSGEVKNLEELLAREHLDYGTTVDADILRYFLPYAEEHPFSTINKHLENRPENIFNTTAEAFDRISEGSFFFLASYRDVAKAEQMSCTYASVGEGFWEYQYALPFQLGSRYTGVFSDAIASLRDDGTLQELENKWFQFRTQCTEATFDIEANRLGIGNLGGMFLMLLMGSVVSLMIHYGEVNWANRTRFKFFKNKKVRKATKNDPLSEMKRKRKKEREELDQQIEEWEGGFDYWINRMNQINDTLENIDQETNKRKPEDEDEHKTDDFSWWTNAYQSMVNSISGKAHDAADKANKEDLDCSDSETFVGSEPSTIIENYETPSEFNDRSISRCEVYSEKALPSSGESAYGSIDTESTAKEVPKIITPRNRIGRMHSFKEKRRRGQNDDII